MIAAEIPSAHTELQLLRHGMERQLRAAKTQQEEATAEISVLTHDLDMYRSSLALATETIAIIMRWLDEHPE